MTVGTLPLAAERPAHDEPARLLGGLHPDGATVELSEHLARWGALDLGPARTRLVAELEASGLSGRGGAAFPVGAKWRSVGTRGRPVVVANGAEGEPASAKDATLLARTPHLVLDGASAAATALGASRVLAYVPAHLAPGLERAVEGRERIGLDPVPVEIVVAPDAFIAGQESAVVNAVAGRGAVPAFQGLTPIRHRGVGGRPTLVQNVETLAHVALVARFGARWFRGVGTEDAPGTALLTVTGRFESPVVLEAPLGTPLDRLLGLGPDAADRYQGALLGGYGGTWVSLDTLGGLRFSEPAAQARAATLGPGVVVLLARRACPLAEVARVVRYLHAQSAGQCGPCVHGLFDLERAVDALAFGPRALGGRLEPVLDACALAEGRGACRHPDGVARFVTSACRVFSAEVAAHLGSGPCRSASAPGVLPVPGTRGSAAGRERPRWAR